MTRHQLLVTSAAMALGIGLAGPASAQPDFVCTVKAYKEPVPPLPPSAQAEIPGGGSATFTGGAPKVHIVVTLQNIGKASAGNFQSRVRRYHNANLVSNLGFDITTPVQPGQIRYVSVAAVPVPTGGTTIQIQAEVDSNKEVDEGREGEKNNTCTLTITTVLRAARPPKVTFAMDLYPIYSHERCVNCHGAVNQPLGQNHPTDSSNCASCHTMPPGWKNAGAPSFWTGSAAKSAAELCQLAKNPTHVNTDLTKWAFAPTEPAKGNPPTPAPGGHANFVQKWNAWANAGKPCS